MSKHFYSLILALTCSLAWGQTDTSSLLLPPPSNSIPVGDMGAHRFFVVNQGTSSSQPLEIPINDTSIAKAGNLKSIMDSTASGSQSRSKPHSKSFESSVKGLQFIKSGQPYDSKENAKWNGS